MDFACACCSKKGSHDKLAMLQECLSIDEHEQESRKKSVRRCFILLHKWKKKQKTLPTLQALRRVLDQHSVFGGRNPMELCGFDSSAITHSDTLTCEDGGPIETEREANAKEKKKQRRLEEMERRKEQAKATASSSNDDHFPMEFGTFFDLDDLGFLMKSLCQAAPQWYYIGLQLGIHPTDLDNISHNHSLFLDGPKSYLREMLKTWLCLASPQAGSLPALLSALKSELVRESGLAKSVEKKSIEYLDCLTLECIKENTQKKVQETVEEEVKVEEEEEEREEEEEEEEDGGEEEKEEKEKEEKVEKVEDKEITQEGGKERGCIEEKEEEKEEEEEEEKEEMEIIVNEGTEVEYEEIERLNGGVGEGEDNGGRGGTARRKKQSRDRSYYNDVTESSSHTQQISGLRARALYDYQAACDDDISFDVDDIIENIEQMYEEWWMGEINGEQGLFPANHVQLI